LRLPNRICADRPRHRRRAMPGAAQTRLRRSRGGRRCFRARGGGDPQPAPAAPPRGEGVEGVQALGGVFLHLCRDGGVAVRRQARRRQRATDPDGQRPQYRWPRRERHRSGGPASRSPRGGWPAHRLRRRAACRHGRGRPARGGGRRRRGHGAAVPQPVAVGIDGQGRLQSAGGAVGRGLDSG
ncbi:hypothetical protein OY671_010178, partial [Metschnikowia pulcherrima]